MPQPARRVLIALAFAASALTPMVCAPAQAQVPYLNFGSASQPKYAAIVIDANSGEVLYENRPDSPRYPDETDRPDHRLAPRRRHGADQAWPARG